MKRAVLYARVSSDDRGNDGRNLQGQIDMGRTYAQEHGYTIVAEMAEDDRGASGAEIDLPQLNRIRDMAQSGEFGVLIVREIDRLSRSLAKQLIVEEELQRTGVGIEYVLGEYPDTPEGRLNKHIRATIAEYEREKINQRMTRGRYNKVKSGKVHLHGNHRPPYGYRVSEDETNFVPYEPEAQIVRLVFQWYVLGDELGEKLSMRGIARRLTEMKVPTWGDIHGATNKKAGYAQWRSTGVREMLRSRTYMGKWGYGTYGGRKPASSQAVEIDVPALVSVEMWQVAQEQMKKNKVTAGRNAKHEYLLRNRIMCECTYQMSTSSRRRRGKLYLYYICGRGSTLPGTKCGAPSFRADHVDFLVWNWLKDWFQDPERLTEKLEIYKAGQDKINTPLLAQINIIDDLLKDNQEQLERLLDLYLSGTFEKNILLERRQRLEDTIAKLEHERERLSTQFAQTFTSRQIQTLTEFAKRLTGGLEVADTDFKKRRQLIKLLDVRAILMVEDGEKIIYPTFILSEESNVVRLSLADYVASHR